MSKGLVKSSIVIREELQKRVKELNLSLTEISNDAIARGMNISIHSLSKYFSNSDRNNLSEENIIWLAYRFGIFITLRIGEPKIQNDGKLKFTIMPYDEQRSLTILNKLYPNVATQDTRVLKREGIPMGRKGTSIRKRKTTKVV